MSHPLEQQLARIRRRVRALLLSYGAAWVVGCLLASLLVFALVDYAVHFEDRGIRMMCSLMVLNLTGWAALRYFWPALRARFSDVELALRIERRFPQLEDRLASTIQFLRQAENDPLAGSASLRREVIAETTGAVEPLNLSDVIDARPIRRVLLTCGAICGCCAIVALAAPRYSAIALARLANPLGDTAWPQTNHLMFTQPVTRIALGSRFEVELVDASGAPLPREVRMHYHFEGDGDSAGQRVEPMKFVGGVMMAGLDDVLRSFEYRAEGGDDNTMPWTHLEVIEPPAVEQLTATLHYPAYTGWPAVESDPHLQAIVGTRVALEGRTTKTIRSATVHFEHGGQFAAQVSADGHGFALAADGSQPLVIRKSGTYTIDLEDRDGFHGGQGVHYEVRAVEDRPPMVALNQPSSDTFVAAGAMVPVAALVKDDLAIKRVELEVTLPIAGGAATELARLKLYEGPATPSQPAKLSQTPPGESRPVDYRLDLATWKLVPGATLSIRVAASDYQPATAYSQARRLMVLSSEELQDRLAERRGFILGELGRILRLERESRAQVGGLEIQLDELGRLQKPDLDHLQQAELTQRQVEHGFAREGEGVPAHIQRLLADLENNKVDNSDFERRMQSMLSELTQLGSQNLPPIARGLTTALKGFTAQQDAGASAAAAAAPAQALAQAGKHQDNLIHALEQMLAELAEWDNYRRFHREVSQLKRDQEELARQTDELGAKTLTRQVEDLEPQQAADLKKLGRRQMELARHFDKLQQRMHEMSGQLRESDPLASDAVDDALHRARELALAGQMRDAGRDVEKNQVGQAAKLQKNAQQGLEELLDILANRRERELDRLVKKLREAEQRLDQFRQQQEGLRKRAAEAHRKPGEASRPELQRLAREQRQLQEEIERFARMLKRLQAQDASRSASRSGAKMGQAGDRSQQGDAQGAAEQAAAAKKDLDDAQNQLAEARRTAEAELAAEQLARLDDHVKSLRGQQQKMLAETRQYDTLRIKNGRFSRAEAISVGQLARQQADAGEEAQSLGKKLAAARVFELALTGAAREMENAARQLEHRETTADTQSAQQRALTRLDQLLESLKADAPKPAQQQSQPGEGGQQPAQQQGDLPSMAELKLLKLMQQEVNQRTLALDAQRQADAELPPERQRDYDDLSREQGELADLLIDLVKPPKKPADEGDQLDRELKRDLRGSPESEAPQGKEP